MKENEENTKAVQQQQQPRMLTEMIAGALQQVEAFKLLRATALKFLTVKSLVNQGGNPYIKSSSAVLIGTSFGVSVRSMEWQPQQTIKHSDGGPDEIIYTVSGECTFNGSTFPVSGVATTRDKFFGKKTVDGKTVFKPLHEIDVASLMQKAVTRLRGAAARGALDLNTLTWEEIATATGMSKDSVAGVSYGGGQAKNERTPQELKDIEEIKELLRYCFMGSAPDAQKWLIKRTTFKSSAGEPVPGKKKADGLSKGQIPFVLKDLRSKKQSMVEAEAGPGGAQ